MTDAAAAAPRPVWRPAPQSPWVIGVVVALALLAVLAIVSAWGLGPFGGGGVTTENAYVRGRTTVIAPQVSGYVVDVPVHDYDNVAAGQTLVQIDDRIYAARVAQARANLANAQSNLANATQALAARRAGVQGQSANLANAQAQLLRARADMGRANDLVRDGSISIRERDQTLAALRAAEAGVRQAQAAGEISRQDLRTVQVSAGGLQAQVDAASAQLRLAEIDLENTKVRAPESGQVGEVGVRLGQYVTNGVQLVSLVPPERWVIANFKEAQTRGVERGQRAVLRVDALGGAKLKGRVERLSPAAGQEFAVLKPDNATGNFVKVPQRIGVRIAIDPGQPLAAALRPGMSVEAKVYVRGKAS